MNQTICFGTDCLEAIPPLALVVLDTAKPSAGRLPDGWELKVKSGQPDVSTTKDGDALVLDSKSVKPSFSLDKSVDLDAAKMPCLASHWKVTPSAEKR